VPSVSTGCESACIFAEQSLRSNYERPRPGIWICHMRRFVCRQDCAQLHPAANNQATAELELNIEYFVLYAASNNQAKAEAATGTHPSQPW
jgi:hypothetical protein